MLNLLLKQRQSHESAVGVAYPSASCHSSLVGVARKHSRPAKSWSINLFRRDVC